MTKRRVLTLLLLIAMAVFVPSNAQAHCDTLGGPVVSAARKALDSGNVNLVLVWVQPTDEGPIRDAFAKASSERNAGGQAKDAADLKFFETLVRIHRAGEGAEFEGIKPADTDLGPAIPAADRAIESGFVDPVGRLLSDTMNQGVQKRFQQVQDRKNYDPNDVAAGRAYVNAYVEYTHYVEGLYQSASSASAHHEHGLANVEHHHHASGHEGHAGDHSGHLPWLLAGLFGLIVIGESGWLVLRSKKAAP